MIVIICVSMYYFALLTIVDGLKMWLLSSLTPSLEGRYNIQNGKLCFFDMKFMSLRNGGDSVNNSSCGRFVYRITNIPSFFFQVAQTMCVIFMFGPGFVK